MFVWLKSYIYILYVVFVLHCNTNLLILIHYINKVLVFLMLFQCHQESANLILSQLLHLTINQNFKKLLKTLDFFVVVFHYQGFQNYCRIVRGVRKPFELF